jgi:hypothetical protein
MERVNQVWRDNVCLTKRKSLDTIIVGLRGDVPGRSIALARSRRAVVVGHGIKPKLIRIA